MSTNLMIHLFVVGIVNSLDFNLSHTVGVFPSFSSKCDAAEVDCSSL